jgi:hypothetical protein
MNRLVRGVPLQHQHRRSANGVGVVLHNDRVGDAVEDITYQYTILGQLVIAMV